MSRYGNQFLPAGEHKRWSVLPRGMVNHVFLWGLLLGAAIAIAVVGWTQDQRSLSLGIPIAVGIVIIDAKLWDWRVSRMAQESEDDSRPVRSG